MAYEFKSHLVVVLVALFVSTSASAQIDFDKTGYYVSLGDSPAAGQGALPVTHGFAYQLYDRGVFGQKQTMDFANIAIRGATADEVQAFQVPQVLCIQPPRIAVRPTVITLLAGANDFLVFFATQGIPPDPPALAAGIAAEVEIIVRTLVFGIPSLPPHCARTGIPGVTVLVGDYYTFDHPNPQIALLLDLALQAFRASLAARLAQVQADIVAAGGTARVALVDTLTAMDGRQGLLLINRRGGFTGDFDFDSIRRMLAIPRLRGSLSESGNRSNRRVENT